MKFSIGSYVILSSTREIEDRAVQMGILTEFSKFKIGDKGRIVSIFDNLYEVYFDGKGSVCCNDSMIRKDWFAESGHKPEVHKNCQINFCQICEGGLTHCTRCGMFEGSLTTHCPGVESYVEHGDTVYKGKEDFFDGKWVQGRRTVFMYPQDYVGKENVH